MSIFSASLSDAELTRSTDTFGCELGRRLEEAKADLAASREAEAAEHEECLMWENTAHETERERDASRALVAEKDKTAQMIGVAHQMEAHHLLISTADVQSSAEKGCTTCTFVLRVLALEEPDMLERLEVK